jgi:cytochrome c biogenesis protein CcmG/thiol:disulfide interchange protein DsbE
MQRPTAAILLLWATPLFALQPDAKTLLRDAAARYRNANSFRIEFETKITSSTPFSGGWSKQVYLVAAADQKYHWESEGTGARRVRISDGQSDWFYIPGMREYSVQSADSTKPRLAVRGIAGGTTESWIKSAIHSLLVLEDDADASVLQHDGVLKIGKAKFSCYVVHTVNSQSFRQGTNSTRDHTYWIDKATGLVRKAVISTSGPLSADDDENDKTRIVEITYTRVELDTAPDPSLFAFKPPADAYLIDDARQPISPSLSIGTGAPDLKLSDKNGTFDLAEFRGKVVLVDFWATWCGACLEEMKAMAQLPQSYSDNGLVIVSVDEDEIPRLGDGYFSSQKFNWRNLHDTGETHRRTWGVTAFPLLVLVDRDGKVLWSDTGAGTNFFGTLRSQLDRPELRLKP